MVDKFVMVQEIGNHQLRLAADKLSALGTVNQMFSIGHPAAFCPNSDAKEIGITIRCVGMILEFIDYLKRVAFY